MPPGSGLDDHTRSIDDAEMSKILLNAVGEAAQGNRQPRISVAIRLEDLQTSAVEQLKRYHSFCCDPISSERGHYPDLKPAQPSYWKNALQVTSGRVLVGSRCHLGCQTDGDCSNAYPVAIQCC